MRFSDKVQEVQNKLKTLDLIEKEMLKSPTQSPKPTRVSLSNY
jgi:hypothetical protein